MQTPIRILLLVLLMGTVWADQIVMKDGDRITGNIVKKDAENLTVNSKNFGTVTLKWADSDRYLNNPVPGRKKNDFLYSTGFGFTFARQAETND